jgi:hypothetical protein
VRVIFLTADLVRKTAVGCSGTSKCTVEIVDSRYEAALLVVPSNYEERGHEGSVSQ